MFEDGPPPLPAASSNEASGDVGTFADLNDENRLTAVADDEYDGSNAEGIDHISAPLPIDSDLEPPEFVDPQMAPEFVEPQVAPEFVKPQVAPATTPHVEPSSRGQSPNSPQDFDSGTSLDNNIVGGENLSSLSLPVSPPYNAQISKPCDSVPPEFPADPGFLETSKDSHSVQAATAVVTPNTSFENCSSTVTESTNKDAVTNDGLRDRKLSGTEEVDVCPAEATDDTAKMSPDIKNVDADGGCEKEIVPENAAERELPDEEDDEFGDFEEFVGADGGPNQDDENDDWANFETASVPDCGLKDTGGTAVGETFSEKETALSAQFTTESANEPALPTLFESLHDDQLWMSDVAQEENSDEQIIPDSGIYETLSEAVKNSSEKKPDETLWRAVSIIEEALALKLQWQESSVRSDFLDSLNVDANQALIRNSGLPAFAQQLEESTVLAPVSVAENAAKLMPVDAKNSLPQSNSAEFLPRIHTEKSTTSQHPPSRFVTIDSLAVPPAQFDWNKSGLTNPLKAGSINASSAILDLDFLATTANSKGASGDGPSNMQVFSTLQKDLAAFGLSSLDDAEQSKVQKNVSSDKPDILHSLMKKNSEKRKYTPVSELSLDARALHDQLPDLDYMLSNVLLFPVVNR